MKNTLVVIDGPTASGKTDIAFELAKRWSCPIVSADSRQIFKEVNIGTAKPSLTILSSVKHYFIDYLEIDATYNVGQYEHEANKLITELFQTHSKIILCGGSGMYIKSVIHGLNDLPTSTMEIRQLVQDLFKNNGISALQNYIRITDPEYYEIVDLDNVRRLSRAVEVYLMTGRPFSSFRTGHHEEKAYSVFELCLIPARDVLYQNINLRVDKMIEEGLVEETKKLMEFRDTQAMDTVGYKEIFAYLDGTLELKEAVELIKQHTRNYAKRQMTWFHKECKGMFIDPANSADLNKALDALKSI